MCPAPLNNTTALDAQQLLPEPIPQASAPQYQDNMTLHHCPAPLLHCPELLQHCPLVKYHYVYHTKLEFLALCALPLGWKSQIIQLFPLVGNILFLFYFSLFSVSHIYLSDLLNGGKHTVCGPVG